MQAMATERIKRGVAITSTMIAQPTNGVRPREKMTLETILDDEFLEIRRLGT
jgi:hypothetical protein